MTHKKPNTIKSKIPSSSSISSESSSISSESNEENCKTIISLPDPPPKELVQQLESRDYDINVIIKLKGKQLLALQFLIIFIKINRTL
jgi:hypothetical protein